MTISMQATGLAPQPERIVITDQNTADWICARAPIQMETPPGYFQKVKSQLQGMANDGRLTQEELAKITREAIVERERGRGQEPGFLDTL